LELAQARATARFALELLVEDPLLRVEVDYKGGEEEGGER
jgi:hypothetical protein